MAYIVIVVVVVLVVLLKYMEYEAKYVVNPHRAPDFLDWFFEGENARPRDGD